MEVDQPQLELQLKVWKELAISKQMMVRAATDALKLDSNCTPDELREAIDRFTKKMAKADAEAAGAHEQAKQAVASIEKRLETTQKEKAAAEAQVVELTKKQDALTQQLTLARAASVKEAQDLKVKLAEKEKQLKAINTALADTPENVLKKMRAAKKEKQDEADARRAVELSFTTLRKEKQDQDQKLTALKTSSGKLITQYRDLHGIATQLHEQLQPLVAEGTTVPAVPALDTDLIEEVEQPGVKKDKEKDKDKAKK